MPRAGVEVFDRVHEGVEVLVAMRDERNPDERWAIGLLQAHLNASGETWSEPPGARPTDPTSFSMAPTHGALRAK
jgi:hypothetical protein